jgi:two-component system, NtrC family, response regulator AtoC
MATILCVDDEASVIALLRKTLERMGHEVLEAAHAAAAIDLLGRRRVDLVVTDFAMPGIDGLELLRLARDEGHEPPFIMLTGHASIEHAVAAIKAGAIDYLAKPFRAAQLELAVTAGLDVARLRRENAALREEVARLRPHREMLGGSEAVRQLLDTAATAAPTRATVLLTGESGTGKEVLARAIHGWSDRADKPFIQVNCAALPDGLIESALFGHEKGAFTGALKRTPGAFERADGGTLLLDEVTEMRIDLQAKLLRVLQEQEFERVGGTEPIRVNVRVIATSNRDLDAAVAEGSFRQDLYYRLAVIPLQLPPLRERREDVPLLARHFAMRAAEQAGRPSPTLLPEAIAWLSARDWPGNVRELQHAVERAVILSPGPILGPPAFAEGPTRALPALAAQPRGSAASADEAGPPSPSGPEAATEALGAAPEVGGDVRLRSLALDEAEAVLIQAALARTGGNRTKAAALLGITDRTLRNKLNPKARPADT